MQVETFEETEIVEEAVEATEEAVKLIDELNLEGQKTLINKGKTQIERTNRCPYRLIRADERFVYRVLCPLDSKVESFSASSMPLRVLQVLAHAKTFDLFKQFQVWSAEGAVKDPVLVAYDSTETWRSSTNCYILARWGDVLDAWPILVDRALSLWKSQIREKLEKAKLEVERDLKLVDATLLETALKVSDISYYGLCR